MSKTLILIGAVVALVAIPILIVFSGYVSAVNYGSRTEALLDAEYQDSQNVLSQYEQKVLEATQVTDLQRDALKDVAKAAITGRYGETGSKAMFQAINEQNPQIDQSTYRQIMQIIEAGRNDFEAKQRTVLDDRREYRAQLGSFFRGAFLSFAGFPKVDLNKYDPVITTRTDGAFKTKRETGPIKIH